MIAQVEARSKLSTLRADLLWRSFVSEVSCYQLMAEAQKKADAMRRKTVEFHKMFTAGESESVIQGTPHQLLSIPRLTGTVSHPISLHSIV